MWPILVASAQSANLEPPVERLAGLKRRRWQVGVGPVAAAGGRLDRELAIAAEVPVANPHAAVRRHFRVPGELDRRKEDRRLGRNAPPPAQPDAIDRCRRQKELAALAV